MIYYEHRNGLVRMVSPILLPKDQAKSMPGFSSVFGYPESTAKIILDKGSSRDIGNLDLYCDELLLDFDSEDGIRDAREFLLMNHLAFQEYHTGNRGCHIHIPIEPISGYGLPAWLKDYVSNVFPGADTSIFKPTGIFRNAGTWHTKNPGSRKELIAEFEGNRLIIPLKEINVKFHHETEDVDAMELLSNLLFKRIKAGNRNNGVYNLVFLAKEAGMSYEEANTLIYNYNEIGVDPPLRSRELDSIINSCYRR